MIYPESLPAKEPEGVDYGGGGRYGLGVSGGKRGTGPNVGRKVEIRKETVIAETDTICFFLTYTAYEGLEFNYYQKHRYYFSA